MSNRRVMLIKMTSAILLLSISCWSSKQTASKEKIFCNENLSFKKEFFRNVENVENLIYNVQDESLKNSLNFIGKYTHVSFESMSNYAGTYPSGIFESDKKIWLEWYEKNKCQNIQFKE